MSPIDIYNGQIFHEEMAKLRAIANPVTIVPRTVAATPKMVQHQALPVDQYREQIIRKISNERVIIIHGETGCGILFAIIVN